MRSFVPVHYSAPVLWMSPFGGDISSVSATLTGE